MNTVLDPHRIEQLQLLGGPDLRGQMYGLFLEHAPDRINGVLKGWEEKDFKRIERNAHSLKSSAGNLGAMELMDLCQKIESAAEQSDETMLSELLVNFKELTQDVLEAVTQEKNTIDEQKSSNC